MCIIFYFYRHIPLDQLVQCRNAFDTQQSPSLNRVDRLANIMHTTGSYCRHIRPAHVDT